MIRPDGPDPLSGVATVPAAMARLDHEIPGRHGSPLRLDALVSSNVAVFTGRVHGTCVILIGLSQ